MSQSLIPQYNEDDADVNMCLDIVTINLFIQNKLWLEYIFCTNKYPSGPLWFNLMCWDMNFASQKIPIKNNEAAIEFVDTFHDVLKYEG